MADALIENPILNSPFHEPDRHFMFNDEGLTNEIEGDLPMDTSADLTRHGVTLPLDRIAELCREYQVTELSVFGSLLRDDFGPESDIDFLVVFQSDDYGPWMGKLQRLEEELGALLGREVELVPKESVLRSANWIRRNHILSTAQVIYGS